MKLKDQSPDQAALSPQFRRCDGGGKRVDWQGIHFVKVRGTAYERSRMHGELLKTEIHSGALPFLSRKNESLIRSAPGVFQVKPFQNLVVEAYHRLLIRVLDLSSTPEARDAIKGICDGAGLPYEMGLRGAFQTEGLMLLSRVSVMKHILGQLAHRGGISGCSSAVALSEKTQLGRLLAARNQDYPIVGPWERHTTVLFQEPSERGRIPNVSVTTAGVHTSGLTSMNREGITLFTHAHFGRRVSLKGTTVVNLGNEMIEKARSIGEAVDSARSNSRYANWAFVVTSAKEDQAVVLEMTPDRVEVRECHEGFLTHSNFFQSPEHAGEEALLSGAYSEDLVARVCSLQKTLHTYAGKLTPELLASALGDSTDPDTGVERVVGNTVSVVTTVKSTVFDPLVQRLWVSTRDRSPQALEARFLEIQADRFWDEMEKSVENHQSPPSPEFISGYHPRAPELAEAAQAYREAYQSWHMDALNPRRTENTLGALRRATAIYPVEGNVWVQRGLVSFVGGHSEESKQSFETALSCSITPHIRAVAELFLGRLADLRGKRKEALRWYYAGLGRATEPRLRVALESGMKRRYMSWMRAQIQLDLQFPDAFHY